ncbi:MAG: hypothetical protein LBI57_01255 [Helicobacteraceae bacterium]|jgi:hypothetical protein|nr:hypothetical protein [Helicobacteraceae bacterium]
MIKKLTLFILPIALFAAVSGDEDYFYANHPYGTIIYAKSAENEAARAARTWQKIQGAYDKDFGFKLRGPTLGLLGFQNQIANAFATTTPFLEMAFYGGGATEIDYFGASDWTLTLLVHEGAHLYQLSGASDFPVWLESAFGHNYMPVIAGVVPFWTYPNELLPTLFMEGNAVFNESRMTGGGRLFGGRHKALFLALLKSGRLDARRLINDHRDFPYLEEKYIVGGFFQAWLASRYGAEKTNHFFAEHGQRWINPLLLNKSLQRHYGASYQELIGQFLSHYKDEANAFKEQTGKKIAETKIYAPIGGDDKALYVYSSDAETKARIIRLDRQTRQVTEIDGHFLNGRPFFGAFGYVTSSFQYTAADRVETGLFDKNRNPIEKFNGEIAQDFKTNARLYLKTDASFSKAILYENDRRIAPVASNARYGANGEIYSVRAQDDKRVFYKDETPLFAISAQAVLCDILPQGGVLFAAPTRYGNGLFLWQKERLLRLGEADNVVDARFIGGEDFLVVGVTGEGYEARVTKFTASLEKPIKPQTVAVEAPIIMIEASAAADTNLLIVAKPYGELRNISLSSIYPRVGYDSDDGFTGGIDAYFSDPLGFNSLTISGSGGKEENGYASAIYDNRRHLLFWGGGVYGEGGKENYERDFGASVYAGYLISKSASDQTTITARQNFDQNDKHNAPIIASLEYDYALSHPYAYKPAYSARVALHGRTSGREDRKEQAFKAEIKGGVRLFWQTYLDAGVSYAKSNEDWIVAQKRPPYPIDPIDYALQNLPNGYRADRAIDYYGEIGAKIDAPIYGLTLPLGLHSIAPIARYERLELGEKRFLVEEQTYALQAELQLAHSVDFWIEGGVVHNNRAKDDRFYIVLKSQL